MAAAPPPPGTTAVLRWLHRADSVADTSPTLARAWQDSARRLAHRRRLPRLEARALLAYGASAAEQADYPAAGAAAHQAWVLARSLGTPSAEELNALGLLSGIAFSRDRLPRLPATPDKFWPLPRPWATTHCWWQRPATWAMA